MDAYKWATEGWLTDATSQQMTQFSGGGSKWAQTLSAAELIQGIVPGGKGGYGLGGTFTLNQVIMANMKKYGALTAGTVLFTAPTFKILRRVLKKPIRETNKLLEYTGLRSEIRV